MAFVLRNIGGTLQRADGEPLAEARVLFRPIGIHGDDGVTILPPIIEAMTDEDGVLDVDLLTSDVPDAFVRYECTAAAAEPFRFDLVNGPATTLDDLYNTSAATSASSSMALLLAAIAAIPAGPPGPPGRGLIGGIIVGEFYDNALAGIATTIYNPAANEFVLAPFLSLKAMRIDQLGIACSAAVGPAAPAKCLIYGSNADGWPDELLFEPGDEINLNGTGYRSHSLDFTFEAGEQYWLGLRTGSTGDTIRAVSTSSVANFGAFGSTGTSYYTALRRTLDYATAAPDPFGFVSGDRVPSVGPPAFRMRAAALP